jgi:hypothetical protein
LAIADGGLKRPTKPLQFSHSGLAAVVVTTIVVVPTGMTAAAPTAIALPPNFLNGISLGHFEIQST